MVTANFVKMHNSNLAQFQVPGVGKIYITAGSFPAKAVPQSLDVTAFGLREPGETRGTDDSAKAAERAAKAQAKAEQAKAKAEARVKKAQEVAEKAQAAAQKALERAQRAAAATTAKAEGADQPEL